MKGEVYRTKVDARDELLDLIMDVITSIQEHQDELRRTKRQVLTRAENCIDVNGEIFEIVSY
jgi:NTP pyrophosphatase (non-canonical NTP hydrolase)